jgi:YfiH family protein
MDNLIIPNWPAPHNVRAYTTTRRGGFSIAPINSFNVAENINDDENAVLKNRQLLQQQLQLPAEPFWLKQVHGNSVIEAQATSPFITTKISTTIMPPSVTPTNELPTADGSFTNKKGVVCVVSTADCMPVFLCDRAGTRVAVVHAGWRGLAAGIIEAAIDQFALPGTEIIAWLGPAIGPKMFEVGNEVRDQFMAVDPAATEAFTPISAEKSLGDLYLLAKQRLATRNVTAIYGGEYCTYSDAESFYSFRRDKKKDRGMASLIWLIK